MLYTKIWPKKALFVACIAFLLLGLLGLIMNGNIRIDITTKNSNARYESITGRFRRAAVVTNSPPCATVGKNILLKGGNAVDAILAAMICDGVTTPQSMGIGGGFFMVIYNKKFGNTTTIVARERAPAAATIDMFEKNPNSSQRGGLSVAVPGEIRGYWTAYKKFGGDVPWKDLFEPSIKLCREGIPVSNHLASKLKSYQTLVSSTEGLRELFVDAKTGLLLEEGETYKNLKLADTLELIAEKGGDYFYEGPFAEALAQDIRDNGGIITKEDLRDYKVRIEEPYTVPIPKYNLSLHTVNPPSSGVPLAYITRLLDGLLPASNELLNTQRTTEALKYGYALRGKLGDRDYVNITKLIEQISSEEFIREVRANVSDTQTWNDPKHYDGILYSAENKGTANLAVLAPNGDAVVATSTINLVFGSGLLSNSTGIILNDEMDDFSSPNITNYFGVKPSWPNFIEPHKMPMSSMCPTIIVDQNGDAILIIGAAGGTKILSSVAIAISRFVYMRESSRNAIDKVLFHHQLLPMQWEYYPQMPNDIVRGMRNIGHTVSLRPTNSFSAVSAIDHVNGEIHGNCDHTRPGHVDGF